MDCYTDLYIANVTRVLEAADGGIDMVYTYDDMGTQQGLLISEAMWREFVLPRHLRLNAAIRRFPVKIMYHSCGAIYPLIGALADEMGIDVLNPLQPRATGMDTARIKRELVIGCRSTGPLTSNRLCPGARPSRYRPRYRNAAGCWARGVHLRLGPLHPG